MKSEGTFSLTRRNAAGEVMMKQIRVAVLVLMGILGFSFSGFADNIVSRPCGFIWKMLGAKSQTLVSTPFRPFDPSIGAVFSNQLTGSTVEVNADKIFKWDAANAQFVQAVKAGGTGNPAVDGNWFADFTFQTPSGMTIEPGESVAIANAQDICRARYFYAAKLCSTRRTALVLWPSLTLFGYPYTAAATFDQTALFNLWKQRGMTNMAVSPDGTVVTVSDDSGNQADRITDPSGAISAGFLLGRGYWFNRQGSAQLIWDEARPYASLFPTDDAPPQIVGIESVDDGCEVQLSIVPCGGAGGRLDIFYQDLAETGRFSATNGWRLAQANIPLNQSDGSSTGSSPPMIQWTDYGDVDRLPVVYVFGRVYLVANGSLDTDANGVPDAQDIFLYGRTPGAPKPVPPGGVSPTNPPIATNTVQVGSGRILYVDAGIGNDSYSGVSPTVAGQDGPKKSINGCLQAAKSGDTVYIRDGFYRESVDLSNRGLQVLVYGNVTIVSP